MKTKSHVSGLIGSKKDVQIRFHDWLCNEFCHGWNPKESIPDEMDSTQWEEIKTAYRQARRDYRLVYVQVSIGDDWQNAGKLTAVVI